MFDYNASAFGRHINLKTTIDHCRLGCQGRFICMEAAWLRVRGPAY